MTRCTGGEQKALFRGHFVTKALLISGLLMVSTGCTTQPIVRVQYVPTKVYLAIPAELTLPVTVDLTGMTYGEGLGSLRAGLERCDGQLNAIGSLKPPPTL